MSNTTADEISAATAEVLDGAYAKLRRALPFMNASHLDTAVADIAQQLADRLKVLGPAMIASKARFSFNMLPAELRIRIYELVLARDDDDEPFEIQSWAHYDYPSDVTRKPKPCSIPSLLHVCRQIRNEAGPIFYSTTPFVATFDSAETPKNMAHQWLEMIGKGQAEDIKELTIRFPGCGYMWMEMKIANIMARFGVKGSNSLQAVVVVDSMTFLTKGDACVALQLGRFGVEDDKVKIAYEEDLGNWEYLK